MRGSVLTPSKLLGIVLLLLLTAGMWVGVALRLEMTIIQISAGLLGLAVGAWRIAPLLMAEPTMIVDYVTRASQASKPAYYDPNRNAAPYYDTLFGQFTPLPEVLKSKYRAWPADLSPEEFRALAEWAPVNESALPVLAQAAACPYWWHELKSTDGTMSGIKTVDLDRVRNCVWGVLLLAKYRASQGDVSRSLQLLADVHRLGVHQNERATLVDQMVGVALCRLSYEALLAVLGHCHVEGEMLRWALHVLTPRIPGIAVPRLSEVEHLYGQDSTQKLFTDDGKGDGILIPRQLYRARKNAPKGYGQRLSFPAAVWICLRHPGRRETVQLAEKCFALAKDLARQTPADLRVRGTSYEKELGGLTVTNYLLRYGYLAMARCIRVGWQNRVLGDATVAILAIFAYQAQESRLPESLEQLVDNGLLLSVPIDPYSDGPLVYKVKGDDFILYSVGEDFVDNGGRPCEWDDRTGGDHVFWPVPARAY
jgi:hypothetical protein